MLSLFTSSLQGGDTEEPLTVIPNLIELPCLPSIAISPSYGNKGRIPEFSTKYPVSPVSVFDSDSLNVNWEGNALWLGEPKIFTGGK